MADLLTETIDAHKLVCGGSYDDDSCSCGVGPLNGAEYSRHVAQAYREATTITTVEQLEALPLAPDGCEGALIKDRTGHICERQPDGAWGRWGDAGCVPSSKLNLPAVLLWQPTESANPSAPTSTGNSEGSLPTTSADWPASGTSVLPQPTESDPT